MLENYVVQWEKCKRGRKHTVIQMTGGRTPGFQALVRNRNLSSLSFTVFICKLGISLAFFLKRYIRSKFHSTTLDTSLLNRICIPLFFPQCWEIRHENIFILVSSSPSSSSINPSVQLWTHPLQFFQASLYSNLQLYDVINRISLFWFFICIFIEIWRS